MKIKILLVCFLLCIANSMFSQEYQNLKDINSQVWQPFTKAFETYNIKLFKSIHNTDLIRVSGNGKSIKNLTEYIEGYSRWQNATRKQTISFRFLERINNDNIASERGIYKLTVNLNTPEEKSYYGKFYVLLKKEAGSWKLLVDYDSDEQHTINETSFKEALAIDNFEKY